MFKRESDRKIPNNIFHVISHHNPAKYNNKFNKEIDYIKIKVSKKLI